MDDKRSLLTVVVIVLGLAIAYFYLNPVNPEPTPQIPQQQWQPQPVPPTTPEPPQQPQQPAPPERIDSYEDAIETARALNKQVYLYFTASWCSWCKKFSSETLSSPRVQNELSSYIVYKVDVDKEKAVASKYGISGVPAHRIVDGNEKEIKSGKGYKGEAAFILWLKTAKLDR